jgi:hypothetical protein
MNSTEAQISKAEAIATVGRADEVYARLNDGSEDRIYAIAWTKCTGSKTTHYLSDINYFFTKD